jgi:malonyl-CoA/methylmalonyl-CoA synthetase
LVNTQYRQVELRHILSDSAARLCVTDAERLGELDRVVDDLSDLESVVVIDGPKKQERACTITASELLKGAAAYQPSLPSGEADALIAYTSGTTGRSKGAVLTHANLAANAWAVTTAWRWTAQDTLLVSLPLFHVHGLAVGLHGTWTVGATAELWRRFDAAATYGRLKQGGITMFFGVPTMYTRLVAEARRQGAEGVAAPEALRLFVSGSAPLSVQTFEDFAQLFGQRILERYGMSETLMNLTNPYHGERRPGTVGQPFPGQEARIVDVQTREPILDERPGEIQVRGPHVFRGYWRQPQATAAAFDAQGWFNTSDLGWRSADGYYTISGRARELIITGGYNVYPREVEEVLVTHPVVAEAAVVGVPDAEFGEQVVAAVIRHPSSSSDEALAEELVALCRDQLASYKKPRRVVFVRDLPRNALGKVQKHVLQTQLSVAT